MLRQRPIIMGIVGDSASGKTTITNGLVWLIGPERVTRICTDDYHKYDRRERSQRGITALHPDCNHMDIMELDLERLHFGQPILKPKYDHSKGTFGRPEYVAPREFVIIEGLLGFATPAMRQFFDIKVYLDPYEKLRRFWKMRRDATKRGYTPEQVLDQLERREHDSRMFIRPQREHADIVVRFYPPRNIAIEEAGAHLNVQLTLRPTIPHPDLSYLWQEPAQPNSGIRLHQQHDDVHPADILEIDGNVSPEHAALLEKTIWQHLPDLRPLRSNQFGYYYEDLKVRQSDPLALTQLLLTYHLLRQYNDGYKLPFAQPVSAFRKFVATAGESQQGG